MLSLEKQTFYQIQIIQPIPKPELKNGDISIADFNNDGRLDFVYTGEDSSGNPVSELYVAGKPSGNYPYDSSTKYASGLIGLRESTVDWVDYDMDGDLDLFLTGILSDKT